MLMQILCPGENLPEGVKNLTSGGLKAVDESALVFLQSGAGMMGTGSVWDPSTMECPSTTVTPPHTTLYL
jgi:hypothetical protein